ncbi:hypothetical protein AB0O80_10590 [Rothia kristinae]|uniref:hypothetical protein n=1 Tax=Actinomycetes TaxID=1760 RepID=UPI003449BE68
MAANKYPMTLHHPRLQATHTVTNQEEHEAWTNQGWLEKEPKDLPEQIPGSVTGVVEPVEPEPKK